MHPAHGCAHLTNDHSTLACQHLLDIAEPAYTRWYTGDGLHYALVCARCAKDTATRAAALCRICPACFARIEAAGDWDGSAGAPGIRARPTALRFVHQDVALPDACAGPLRAIAPVDTAAHSVWVALTGAGMIVQLDLDAGTEQPLATLPAGTLDLDAPVTLQLAPDGRLAALVNTFGRFGQIIDLTTGAATMPLDRGDYHADVCQFPVAFFTHAGRTLLVHATDWNRLDITDPLTGQLRTAREPTSYQRGEPRPPHYLDYFHCGLSVSPDQAWIVDNGWVWHPWGSVRSWSLARWYTVHCWESEDGPTLRTLCDRANLWDAPLCWVDATTLAVWGEGRDAGAMLPAVRIFDVGSGAQLRWFAGPDVTPASVWPPPSGQRGWLVCDGWLFAVSPQHGTAVWDVARGERLHHDPACIPTQYHRGAQHFLTIRSDRTVRLSTLVGTA